MSAIIKLNLGLFKNWKSYLIIGIIGCLVVYLMQVDMDVLMTNLISGWWKVALMIPVSGLAYFTATLAWRYCMNEPGRQIPLRKLFAARHIGESLALINPTNVIAGDLSKVYFLKQFNIDHREGVLSVLLSRALIILSGILLSCMAFCLWMVIYLPGDSMVSFTILPILGILVVYISWRLVTHRRLFIYQLMRFLVHPLRKYDRVQTALVQLKRINALIVIKKNQEKGQIVKSWIFSITHWIFGALEFYLLLLLLGIDIGFSGSLILEMGVTVIKNIGAFIPGQLGIEEIGNKVMLSVVGVTSPLLWVAVSVFKRTRQLSWLLIGMIMYYFVIHR